MKILITGGTNGMGKGLALFLEAPDQTLPRSGKSFTWKKGAFTALSETPEVLDPEARQKLWDYSTALLKV